MVCFGWAGDDGFVTDRHVAHYEARAQGGVGLIILEAHAINKAGRLASRQLGLWSDEHIPGLRRIADACHKHGAVVLVQIHHAGRNTPKDVCVPSLAPSDENTEKRQARAMTIDEIRATEQEFVDAALRAEQAGLDGVELHGAHGYLLCQFMSPITNQRSDAYGGDIAKRMRFGAETVARIRAAVKSDFIVGYRMGGNEPTLEEGIAIAQELERRGVDLLHVSSGISAGDPPVAPEGFGHSWIVYHGSQIRKHVRVPVIVVYGVKTPEQALDIAGRELADFVAVGKGLLVDPEWANKAREKREILTCLGCATGCRWFVDSTKCLRLKKSREQAAKA
jgi:2,4-dienoyl-CoA reductase-like NADH-dependent reductase (Old Yellow Enzyme family)